MLDTLRDQESAPALLAWTGQSLAWRRLTAADRHAVQRHLEALTPDDVELRFGCALAFGAIERYVTSIDFDRDIVLALEAAGGDLAGLAQIIRCRPHGEASAEVAFSVEPSGRGRGLGTRLMQLAVQAARAERFDQLYAQVCPRNAAMVAILREAGMRFVREDSEMLGILRLTDGPDSVH